MSLLLNKVQDINQKAKQLMDAYAQIKGKNLKLEQENKAYEDLLEKQKNQFAIQMDEQNLQSQQFKSRQNQLELQNIQLSKANKELNEKIEQLEQEKQTTNIEKLEQNNTLQQSINQLKSLNNDLSAEIEMLKELDTVQKRENAELEEEKRTLFTQIEELKTQKNKENQLLTEEKIDLRDKLNELKKQNYAINNEFEIAKQNLIALTTDKLQMEAQQQALQKQINELQALNKTEGMYSNEQNTQLQNKIEQLSQYNQALSGEFLELKKQYLNNTDIKNKLAEDCKKFLEQIEQLKEENKKVKLDYKQAKQQEELKTELLINAEKNKNSGEIEGKLDHYINEIDKCLELLKQ